MAMILRDLKDPRIDLMTSVVKVDTSRDLKYCKIYVSVLGDDEKKADVMQALQAAASFIRRQLAQRLNLRNTPELTFLLDDSMNTVSIWVRSLKRFMRPIKSAPKRFLK